MTSHSRSCLSCSKPLRGRADKKFCDDYCRNSYNNQLRSDRNNYMRNVNNALRRNRRILETLLQGKENTAKVEREKLNRQGFHFKYHTHLYTNRKGSTYFYCYEYGYLPLGEDWCILVKRGEKE